MHILCRTDNTEMSHLLVRLILVNYLTRNCVTGNEHVIIHPG